jgi:hypothetical protein
MKAFSNFFSKTICRVGGSYFDLVQSSFPAVVRIETTNACNACCTICPRKDIQRRIARMDDDLFTRLIDECARHKCREIHLHNFGEPLMDKRLEDRVSYAKWKGIKKVKIFSNGSLLNCDRAKGLIEAGLDEIKISIDGATKEEFERIRVPLKYETVMENIANLIAMRNTAHSPLKVHITCCSTTDKQGTMSRLKNMVDGFCFTRIHNWSGSESSECAGRTRKPCQRLWKSLTVLAGGEVALCCLDYDGRHILGHVDEKTTIHQIWNGPSYERVRGLHKEGRQAEIPLCANCTKSFM